MNFKRILRAWRSVVAVAASLTLASIAMPAPPTFAAAPTSVAWNVSNTQTSATSITYAFNLKTATAGTIKSITMTLPNTVASSVPVIARIMGSAPAASL